MIKTAFVAWLLIAACAAQSQLQVTNLTAKENKVKERFQFPLVRGNTPAVQRMNNYMQSHLLLNTTQKTPVSNLFNRICITDSATEMLMGVTGSTYTIYNNAKSILSLEVWSETMGAYPDQFSTYFNFYIPTGELIYLNDLFGGEGLQQLNKYLQQKRINLIKEHLKLYEADSLAADDMDYMKTTLTDCNKEQNLQYFIIEKDSILFFNESCFPHAAMNFEANLAVKTPIKKLLPWLSNNGRAVLGIQNAKPVLSGINKPFYGTINNKLGIVLQFEVGEDGSCHGMYYYTSQGIGIECSGSFTNNQLSLQCSEDSAEQFTGTYSNNTITGNWHHLKTGKALPFSVKN
jgi:hypothetical protein